MPEKESTDSHRTHSSPTPPKRPQVLSGRENTRSKRAKYNTNACDDCKKRKLKCNRDEGERDCYRCMKTGRPCIYAHSPPLSRSSRPSHSSTNVAFTVNQPPSEEQSPARISVTEAVPVLGDDIASLREQVQSLGTQLKGLSEKLDILASTASPPANPKRPSHHDYSARTSFRQHEPQQPLFVGHTRSAFSIDVAKTGSSSPAPSPRESSSEPGLDENLVTEPLSPAADPLLTIPLTEVCRLITVFHEEIEALYPFVNSDDLIAMASVKMKEFARQMEPIHSNSRAACDMSEDKDINILKIAVAIAVVIEAKGKNSLSSKLIDSTDKKAAQVTRSSDATYYFQIDEDLLAWRTIGNAARMTLEMGLHRRRSLMDNYKSPDHQEKASRIFWCIYALDRRWSFGIGLSFALNDRDIDPELPEPGDEFAHLRCLIGWGRLCSKVWEALPPYGSPTTAIPVDQVQYLDFLFRNWLDSIPAHLQFNHPRLGLAARSQPRILRRLCALLYLRGNHLRTLVHRHNVLSPSLVRADLRSARLVVDIAKDSIQVLVNLAETSDIYARQQATFNYFLLSAPAVILLAVCNAPKTFSDSCHESFSSAVELVRNFSRGSLASKRLWRSIRGLLPAVRALGLKIGSKASNERGENPDVEVRDGLGQREDPPQQLPVEEIMPQITPFTLSPEGVASIPNTFQMGNDLMGLFNVFGQVDAETTMFEDSFLVPGSNYIPTAFPMEISRRFQGLI
ncbi:fungal-specific transcription factor domain-containing protein [Xylaria digitata]|nr:fungal-specific transcription factor domain-containing protein [Xylaria digitata]